MAVMVEGAKVVKLEISVDAQGETKVAGTYHLMSNGGKVLAKQDFGGYNGMVVSQSPQTIELVTKLMGSLQQDLATTLGL